ncbi:MAG: preprotein translocase subunit SecE [Candidatus Pacebacteria bacterium]|nr:preprotein translocase subunit SecE [Candidatus Paceibacterota bacterium]
MSLFSYFQETQAELRHVAWPTRTQTIVYTVLVVIISLFISLYLGLFDYIFTSTLARLAGVAPAPAAIEQTTTPVATSTATTTPIDFELPTE